MEYPLTKHGRAATFSGENDARKFRGTVLVIELQPRFNSNSNEIAGVNYLPHFAYLDYSVELVSN